MRDYSKISPQFWVGNTGRQIRKLGVETQLIALYLLTCPHANMIGIYYLPLAYIAHDTGIPIEATSKALQSLYDIDFCCYDEDSEYIWIYEMAVYQISEQLDIRDKRVKGVNETYQSLPDLPFLKDFYDKYHQRFHLEKERENTKKFSPLEAPSKPLVSQEQEQNQEQKQEQNQEQDQQQERNSCDKPFHGISFADDSINTILSIPLKNQKEFVINPKLAEEWKMLYPGIDVLQTLRNIVGWNQANPSKRKTEQEILKHIHSWFAREQEKQQNHSQNMKKNFANSLYEQNCEIAHQWATDTSIIIEELDT